MGESERGIDGTINDKMTGEITELERIRYLEETSSTHQTLEAIISEMRNVFVLFQFTTDLKSGDEKIYFESFKSVNLQSYT